jgi:hypothetical protein
LRFIPECTVWPLTQTLASFIIPPTKRVVVAGIKCASQAIFTIVGAPAGADSPHGIGTCLGAGVLDGDLTCPSHSSFLLVVGMMFCDKLMRGVRIAAYSFRYEDWGSVEMLPTASDRGLGDCGDAAYSFR